MLLLKGIIFIIMYFVSEYIIAMNNEERNMVTNVFRSRMKRDKI